MQRIADIPHSPGDYVVDAPDPKDFRVDRAVYADPSLFEAELTRIFESTWVYLCHASEIPTPGDYVTTHIGRQPVVVNRRKDGSIGALVNACAHRGTLLAPLRRGRAKAFTCRFHGWTYDDAGRNIRIKAEEHGGYPAGFASEAQNLVPVPQVGIYRDFVFGCLNPDEPPLDESLGAAARWIDLMADQSPEGLEVVPGDSVYIVRGNWKMAGENGVDGYHVSTVHRVFASTLSKREERYGADGLAKTEAGRITGTVPSGCADLGNGHTAIWAKRQSPEAAPLYEAKDALLKRFPAAQVDWMIGVGRNLFLFPNMLLMDQPSTQIRTIRPLAHDRAEVRIQCIAPKGESAAARKARLRKFLDFYLPTGMATSDDIAALEDTNLGIQGRLARWNDYGRGAATTVAGIDNPDLAALGCHAVSASPNWDHETLYLGFYRRWRELMEAR